MRKPPEVGTAIMAQVTLIADYAKDKRLTPHEKMAAITAQQVRVWQMVDRYAEHYKTQVMTTEA